MCDVATMVRLGILGRPSHTRSEDAVGSKFPEPCDILHQGAFVRPGKLTRRLSSSRESDAKDAGYGLVVLRSSLDHCGGILGTTQHTEMSVSLLSVRTPQVKKATRRPGMKDVCASETVRSEVKDVKSLGPSLRPVKRRGFR